MEKIIDGGVGPIRQALELVDSLKTQKPKIEKLMSYKHQRDLIAVYDESVSLLNEYYSLDYDPLTEALDLIQSLAYLFEDFEYIIQKFRHAKHLDPESYQYRQRISALVWRVAGECMDKENPGNPFNPIPYASIPDIRFTELTNEQRRFIEEKTHQFMK